MLFCARFVRARQNRQRSSAWVCGQAHQDAHKLPSPWLWWGCSLCYNWNVVSLSGASVQQYKEPFRQLRWMLWHSCNMHCMNSCFFAFQVPDLYSVVIKECYEEFRHWQCQQTACFVLVPSLADVAICPMCPKVIISCAGQCFCMFIILFNENIFNCCLYIFRKMENGSLWTLEFWGSKTWW